MNKVKRIKNKEYTTISNVFLRDTNLSLKAKGFLAMVMALPNDWDFSISGIVGIVKEGKTAIYSTIKELKDNKYCVVETIRDEKGKVVGNDYTFYENPNLENLNVDNQPQQSKDSNKLLTEKKNESDKSLSKSDKKLELFETCWIAYRRKGHKKLAKEQWIKLKDEEKESVLPHIQVYVNTRELVYQADFERYLKNREFQTIIVKGNIVVYDPYSGYETNTYHPITGGALMWNDYYKCYLYTGWYNKGDRMYDGYEDEKRPDGATIVLNNGRGKVVWNKEKQEWMHEK